MCQHSVNNINCHQMMIGSEHYECLVVKVAVILAYVTCIGQVASVLLQVPVVQVHS